MLRVWVLGGHCVDFEWTLRGLCVCLGQNFGKHRVGFASTLQRRTLRGPLRGPHVTLAYILCGPCSLFKAIVEIAVIVRVFIWELVLMRHKREGREEEWLTERGG